MGVGRPVCPMKLNVGRCKGRVGGNLLEPTSQEERSVEQAEVKRMPQGICRGARRAAVDGMKLYLERPVMTTWLGFQPGDASVSLLRVQNHWREAVNPRRACH